MDQPFALGLFSLAPTGEAAKVLPYRAADRLDWVPAFFSDRAIARGSSATLRL